MSTENCFAELQLLKPQQFFNNKVRRQKTRCFFFWLLNFRLVEIDEKYQLLTT